MDGIDAEIVLKTGDTETVLGTMVALTSISMGIPTALESIIASATTPKNKNYCLILIETDAKEDR